MRVLYADAVAASQTLLVALNAALKTAKENIATGTVLIGASANGASTTFEVTDGGMTPQDLFGMWSEMLDRYDAAKTTLGGTPTDAQVYAQMLTALGQPVRRFHSRYAGLHG